MKSKLLVFSLLIVFLVSFVLGWRAVLSPTNDKFTSTIVYYIPANIKLFLKKTVFFIPDIQNKIAALERYNNKKKISNAKKTSAQDNIISEILSFLTENGYIVKIPFSKKSITNTIVTEFSKYSLTQYKISLLYNGTEYHALSSGYFEEYQDKIIIATGDGNFIYFNVDDLALNKFEAQLISTNIRDLVKYREFYIYGEYRYLDNFTNGFGIKNLLIYKDKVYISLVNELSENCYNLAVFVANINFKDLVFEEFFNPSECIKQFSDYGEFQAVQSGGKIIPYKNNKLLLSIGEFRNRDHAQNDESVFGKMVAVDLITKEWEIISKGHRNSQGVYYENQKDYLLMTEHGPKGGDEININYNLNDNIIENYGWPISSYGEHYGHWRGQKISAKIYEKAPLNKSHSKYGFIEPMKYYVPSIAIGEIIKIPDTFNESFDNDFFISSLGHEVDIGANSIHHIKFSDDFKKIIQEEIIPIDQRIRDLIYIKDINKIILYLESSGSIGILSAIK